jgi:hypothetical protein
MLMLRLWVALCVCRNGQKLVCCSATNALLAAVSSHSTHFRRKIVYGVSDHVSQKLSAPATTVSLNRLAVATMRRYSLARTGEEKGKP